MSLVFRRPWREAPGNSLSFLLRCLPTCLLAAMSNRKWEQTRFCSESTQLTALAGFLKGASLLSSKASPSFSPNPVSSSAGCLPEPTRPPVCEGGRHSWGSRGQTEKISSRPVSHKASDKQG